MGRPKQQLDDKTATRKLMDQSDPQSSERDQESPESQCIACGASIPRKAKLCRHCRSFQSNWKNALVYAAQITTLIAAAATAVVFLVAKIPDARKILWWRDDARVLAFQSNQQIVVANRGDGPIFASHMELVLDMSPFGQRTTTQRIDLLIPAEELRVNRFDNDLPAGVKYVGGISEEVWRIAVERAFRDSGQCFWPVVTLLSEPSLLQVQAAYQRGGQRHRTFPASASLYYYSVGSDEMKALTLEVVGYVVFRDAEECTQR